MGAAAPRAASGAGQRGAAMVVRRPAPRPNCSMFSAAGPWSRASLGLREGRLPGTAVIGNARALFACALQASLPSSLSTVTSPRENFVAFGPGEPAWAPPPSYAVSISIDFSMAARFALRRAFGLSSPSRFWESLRYWPFAPSGRVEPPKGLQPLARAALLTRSGSRGGPSENADSARWKPRGQSSAAIRRRHPRSARRVQPSWAPAGQRSSDLRPHLPARKVRRSAAARLRRASEARRPNPASRSGQSATRPGASQTP